MKWYDAQHSTGSTFPAGPNRRAATVPPASPVTTTKDAVAAPKLPATATSTNLASPTTQGSTALTANSGDFRQSSGVGSSTSHLSPQLAHSLHTEGTLSGSDQTEVSASTDLLAVFFGSSRDYIAEKRDVSC